jgi:hypothetical protein
MENDYDRGINPEYQGDIFLTLYERRSRTSIDGEFFLIKYKTARKQMMGNRTQEQNGNSAVHLFRGCNDSLLRVISAAINDKLITNDGERAFVSRFFISGRGDRKNLAKGGFVRHDNLFSDPNLLRKLGDKNA